jgi:hypothetical protein
MEKWVSKTKDTIKKIIEEMKKLPVREGDPPRSLKFGIVVYRDHPPEDKSYVKKVEHLNDEAPILEYLKGVTCDGGGDAPEAVMDGLKAAVDEIKWREKSMRFIFHITDAPPHGELYTGKRTGDRWPDGCPCNIKIEDLAGSIRTKHIKYILLKIGT